MKQVIINFLKVGIYKSKEQALEIASMNMNYTIITPQEFADIVVAVEEYFNPPTPETLEEPVVE